MADSGWANPELLCETDWLAAHQDDADVVLVDCDLLPAYQRTHIPGAVWSISRYWKGEGSKQQVHAIDDPQQFAELMGKLGIRNDTHVVAYDGSGSLYAARMWWTLRRFGHTNCQVLHGGLDKWYDEGRPLERANVRPEASQYQAPTPVDGGICRIDDVTASIGDDAHVFWDVRSDAEWEGSNTRGTNRGGRLPGAVHLEWMHTLNEPVRTFKSPDELRRQLAELGLTPDKTVTTY